ncbi:MAG: hypothetical protein M1821_006061 [Bathelium mastoideum]|nr:MAG: hypothetical protein M1821_006061 [Bathelium mastoideum]KAI9688406.1 MAG: hypothetical protein M1822_001355 [Bathelium mastoideum]
MATRIRPTSASLADLKSMGVVEIQEIDAMALPSVLVIYDAREDAIVRLIAQVLGRGYYLAHSIPDAESGAFDEVVGVARSAELAKLKGGTWSRTIINTCCIDDGRTADPSATAVCDYEYLYTEKPFCRRDLTKFLAFVLGQFRPHEELAAKASTTFISTTFPDVQAALPNLEILSVGSDALELRVDLLKEPLPDGSFSPVPSLNYVGKQVMMLRQRSELPIIYTTRCTQENGRFPMDDPSLYFEYLHRAIKWGCEYIDVELWLPEEVRSKLAAKKGNSKIISAFHDFSGTFKWTSAEAQELFRKGALYGDVVKMIAYVNSINENYELEYFRSTIQTQYKHPPLSGLNMGPMGQLSRALNKVFTPITHPLLPMIAAPGQLSAAEINQALHSMGQLPKLDMYVIGGQRAGVQAMFFEKCFNELSLPHQLIRVERTSKASVEPYLRRPNFGGAYVNPPLALGKNEPSLTLSDAAQIIGQVDTIVVRSEGQQTKLIGENASWKGIRATLTRDFVPSAYHDRPALLLSNNVGDAAAAIFALKSLNIGPIYTIGFKAPGPIGFGTEPFRSVEELKKLEQPFVIISALPADKSLLVGPLLKHYGANGRETPTLGGKVFMDLANGPRKGDSLAIAASLGWTAYGAADISAWTVVETLRILVGQNVPYDFVRLASGRGLY